MSENPSPKLPATLIAKLLDIPVEFVYECGALAWPISKFVNYYELAEVKDFADADEGKEKIKKMRQHVQKTIEEISVSGVTVAWKQANKIRVEKNCLVTDTGGKMLWIETASGDIVRRYKKDFYLHINGVSWGEFMHKKNND